MRRKIALFIIPLIFVTAIFLIFVLVFSNDNAKGALQVTSTPPSKVYLDGKIIGETPLCLCDLPKFLNSKQYSIKLVPDDNALRPFEEKIKINPSVLTVVDRTFGKSESSTGAIITLSETGQKDPQALIVSFPNKANIFLDNDLVGNTPLLLKKITASDHEIRIIKDGYTERTIKIRAIEQYRVEIIAYLGIKEEASVEAMLGSSNNVLENKVTIKSTPTGFLRVRKEASLSSVEVGQVHPGDTFTVISEKDGWYKIKLSNGKTGWVSSDYAEKI